MIISTIGPKEVRCCPKTEIVSPDLKALRSRGFVLCPVERAFIHRVIFHVTGCNSAGEGCQVEKNKAPSPQLEGGASITPAGLPSAFSHSIVSSVSVRQPWSPTTAALGMAGILGAQHVAAHCRGINQLLQAAQVGIPRTLSTLAGDLGNQSSSADPARRPFQPLHNCAFENDTAIDL